MALKAKPRRARKGSRSQTLKMTPLMRQLFGIRTSPYTHKDRRNYKSRRVPGVGRTTRSRSA